MKASNPSGAKGRERTARRAMAIAAAVATASFVAVGPAAAAPASTPHSAAPAAAAAATRSRMLTLINGDRVLKIVEIPDGQGRRGCHVYMSLTEYIVVDQSLHEMMLSLGFEERQ